MYVPYVVGVISGLIVSYYYNEDKEKYDTWMLIAKAIFRGLAFAFCRRLKRKFSDPDFMGASGICLRGGNMIIWSDDEIERSARSTPEEITERMNNGDGEATYLLDIVDADDACWRIWTTGKIVNDTLWPFNGTIVLDEREGVTEAVVEIGKSGDKDHKSYTLTAHFISIDGPFNNFGANTNVPIWVALKMMLPYVDCLRLQEAEVQVGTIHGSVMVTGKKTLNELHRELIEMEQTEKFRLFDGDGDDSD